MTYSVPLVIKGNLEVDIESREVPIDRFMDATTTLTIVNRTWNEKYKNKSWMVVLP